MAVIVLSHTDMAKATPILNLWVGRLEITPIAVLVGSVLQRPNLYRCDGTRQHGVSTFSRV